MSKHVMRHSSEIINLLNSTDLSASDITRPLKDIGDGNMLRGVKTMCEFSRMGGEFKGTIKGAVGAIVGAVVFREGYKACRNIYNKHKEDGKRIREAFYKERYVSVDTEVSKRNNENTTKEEF